MFPMDDRGERPLECQAHFAVQRTFGAEGKQDYFLLSDAECIGDEIPFSRDGVSWGECDGTLAIKAYSEPPCVLTFHEVSPAAGESLDDLAAAKVEESSLDAGEDCWEQTDRSR